MACFAGHRRKTLDIRGSNLILSAMIQDYLAGRTTVLLLFPIVLGILIISVIIIKRMMKRKAFQREQLRRLLQIGKQGEEDTIYQLSRVRGPKYILHNLYVPLNNGAGTTEIDMILIHKTGIFVIENKNYAGWIYGDESESRWLQVQTKDGKRWEKLFYSPIRQNQNHIRNLKHFLEEAFDWDIPYCSVIVFNDKAKLKRIRITSEELLVSESRKIKRRLHKKMRRMKRVFGKRQMAALYQRLAPLENPGKRVKRQHEKYVSQAGARHRHFMH